MPHATHSSRLAAHADLTATSEAHFVVLPDGHVLFARGEGLTRVGLEMEGRNYFDLFEETRPDFCELIRSALRGETPLPFRCEYGGLTWVCEVAPKPCEGGFAAACTARAIEPPGPQLVAADAACPAIASRVCDATIRAAGVVIQPGDVLTWDGVDLYHAHTVPIPSSVVPTVLKRAGFSWPPAAGGELLPPPRHDESGERSPRLTVVR